MPHILCIYLTNCIPSFVFYELNFKHSYSLYFYFYSIHLHFVHFINQSICISLNVLHILLHVLYSMHWQTDRPTDRQTDILGMELLSQLRHYYCILQSNIISKCTLKAISTSWNSLTRTNRLILPRIELLSQLKIGVTFKPPFPSLVCKTCK